MGKGRACTFWRSHADGWRPLLHRRGSHAICHRPLPQKSPPAAAARPACPARTGASEEPGLQHRRSRKRQCAGWPCVAGGSLVEAALSMLVKQSAQAAFRIRAEVDRADPLIERTFDA